MSAVSSARHDALAREADVPTYRLQLITIWSLLVISLLTWRTGTYYSGGIDSVVAAKGVVCGLAFVIAFGLMHRRPVTHVIGVTTVAIVTTYLLVTVIGAWSQGSPVADVVLSLRVYVVMLTVACVVVSFSRDEVLDTLFTALTGIGLVLGVAGLRSFAATGRLSGGLLPVFPNQLALLYGPPILGVVWRIVNGRARRLDVPLLCVLAGFTFLTGSRTGLLGLAVGILIILAMAPRMQVGTFVALLLGVPALFYIVAFTPFVSAYFARQGEGRVTTLNSRTIAWEAAFRGGKTLWQQWFGGGLAVKTVAVTGTYWDTQVVDSSWVSTYIQAGRLGLLLLGLWALVTLWRTATSPAPYRALLLALTVYVIIRSILESGLLDSYVLNVLMLVPAFLAEVRPRTDGPTLSDELSQPP